MNPDVGGSQSHFTICPLPSHLALNELLKWLFKLFKRIVKYLSEKIQHVQKQIVNGHGDKAARRLELWENLCLLIFKRQRNMQGQLLRWRMRLLPQGRIWSALAKLRLGWGLWGFFEGMKFKGVPGHSVIRINILRQHLQKAQWLHEIHGEWNTKVGNKEWISQGLA